MTGILKRGFWIGLQTTWTLSKIIFPITIIITILQYTPVLDWVIDFLTPFMGLIGLSGDAVVPLVLGNFLNLYAAIGAILSFDLTVKEVFILAVMLSFSHNLLIESGVAAKVGVKLWIMIVVRVGLAFISAFLINLFWNGGTNIAKYGFIPTETEELTSWGAILWSGVEKGFLGILPIALIVIPLMIGIQVLRELKWIDMISKWMSPFTKILGMKENTSLTLASGLIFGLAYGAGVMIQAAKEDNVDKKDLTLAFIFLVACHAVIEDTVIFIPLGIPVLPLLIIRFVVAVLLTITIALIWKKVDQTKSKTAVLEQKI